MHSKLAHMLPASARLAEAKRHSPNGKHSSGSPMKGHFSVYISANLSIGLARAVP